ncbi:AMP-binding protein [Streptomyces winkii]|uniref:AMP-binding protein n=1 Tax=Streptomyces winkii TaxID=3051178 RepID=UPI0028D3958B|nr:AMP-binding protein [Streptomyces sp. DSM 40971]
MNSSWHGRTVGALFREQAARRPDLEAVVGADGELRRTYGELARDVDALTEHLVDLGVGREVSVGVLLPRSYELVVSMLAALCAGGVYTPLNPALPDSRLSALAEDTRPPVVLSSRALDDRLHGAGPAGGVVRTDVGALLSGLPPRAPRTAGDEGRAAAADRHAPEAAAYVIQTSGSTGRPKSVQVGMEALVNTLTWCRDACGIHEGSRVLQVIASSFDASIRSYLTPLLTGASLTLFQEGPYDPQALLATLGRERISVFNPAVPSQFYPVVELAAADGFRQLRSLRCLALGAESPDLSSLRPWIDSDHFDARILNVYGPTEAADIACYAELATAG